MFKRVLLLSCASGAVGMMASAAHAATAEAQASAGNATSVTEIVVTAEKREQNLQTVAIAISAFSAAKRDAIGINSIQDMTNFTPGLTYSTSTDRITLRGVGRTTNVLSADAPVANYDDGLYETFAVAAGRSSLDLANVEVQRGPQGTLGGRNALAGSLDEITNRPTSSPYAEARITLGNYGHFTGEAVVSGPIDDVWSYRVYANWEKQDQGWIKNIVPGQASEGNNINEWYVDVQLQAHFNDHLDMWTKFQSAQWFNPSGGPGDLSAGWAKVGFPSYQWQVAGVVPLAGYACAPGFLGSNVHNASPTGCNNPGLNSPWTEANTVDHSVELPAYYSINTQWTWHNPGFDIKWIGGGTYYHYELWGPTEGDNAPITSFNQPCSFAPTCGSAGSEDQSHRLVHLPGVERLLERRGELHLHRRQPAAVDRGRLPILPILPAAGQRRRSRTAATERLHPFFDPLCFEDSRQAGNPKCAPGTNCSAGSITGRPSKTSRTPATAKSTTSSRRNGS